MDERREEILTRLWDERESAIPEAMTTEMKNLMRQSYNWGKLIERDRIKGVLGKASVEMFVNPKPTKE